MYPPANLKIYECSAKKIIHMWGPGWSEAVLSFFDTLESTVGTKDKLNL